MRTREPVRIITVSRHYGSGGGDIAQMLGEALGWRVIDHALIEEVARRLDAPEPEVEALDEYVGGIVERIAGVFARGVPDSPAGSELPDPDMIARLARAVLRDAANDLPFIAVGHGGQCIFADRPDALHVRIVAPLRDRASRVGGRRGLEAAEALRETERRDAERRRYMQHYFGCDSNDPLLYTIQLDTGYLTLEEATRLILQIVEWRSGDSRD